jgi:hypothetical protein
MNPGSSGTITFECESCGRSYTIGRENLGKRARCRSCGHVQRIAEPATPPERAPSAAKREPSAAPVVRFSIFHKTLLAELTLLLVVLSICDVFMTYHLLRTSAAFFESNPVARWFFARWNMAGMVLFKFSILIGVIAISEFAERHRPSYGRFVLGIGCLGTTYAVLKGLSLYLGFTAE